MLGIFGNEPGSQPVGVYQLHQLVYKLEIFRHEYTHFGLFRLAVAIVHMVGAQPRHFVYYAVGKTQTVFAEGVPYDVLRHFFVPVHIAEFVHAVRLAYIVHQCRQTNIGRCKTHGLEGVLQNVVLVIERILRHARAVFQLGNEIFYRAYLVEKAQRAVLSVGNAVFGVGKQNFHKFVAAAFDGNIF